MPSVNPYSCAKFIREIGRGKDGARGLSREQSAELLTAILNGRVSDLELGGVLIALRVKGESTDELLGFMDALSGSWPVNDSLTEKIDQLNAQSDRTGKPVVVIPTYNGARRKPNFTPLLAGLLSQKGYPVLCHGLQENRIGRVTTQEIFDCLQWPVSPTPVFMGIEVLYPALGQLLSKQQILGVRNFSHTMVKLLVPSSLKSSLLVTSYTHPEFQKLQTEVLSQYGQRALVLRGHEGEAVAAPYRVPRMDLVQNGECRLFCEQEPSFSEKPDPHPDISAPATAELTTQWLSQPDSLPHGFLKQLSAIEALAQSNV